MPAPRIDWGTVHNIAQAFRFAMPRTPIKGRLGERLGSGTGSSLEFQDYRQYAAGDDIRHVDWAAYARSEVLTVRLYREEVAPRIDLLFDVSRSMAVTAQKHDAYAAFCALIALASASTDAETRVVTTSGAEPAPLQRPQDIERLLLCEASASALEGSRVPFRSRSLRIVVSDFLFPHDGDLLVGQLAHNAASLAIIQFTLKQEAEPAVEGARRLMDVEGHGEIDLLINERAVQDYCDRFHRLRAGLSSAARRCGASFVHITAETPLRDVVRALAAAAILERT